MPHSQTATLRVIALDGTYPASAPGPDGRFRSTVLEEPYLDPFGRSMFTAINRYGVKIDDGVAGTPERRERELELLWEAVESADTRHLSLAIVRADDDQ
jgi:hypothetical protein